MNYAFWNNKGGTGKTSLLFQVLCRFAEKNPQKRILAIDVCPQANLSELLLGGLEGTGGDNLSALQQNSPRTTLAGYFQIRLPSPYAIPQFDPDDFICRPYEYNQNIPTNIHLVAGDALVELQTNALSTLANTQIPGTDTWLAVVSWLRDFIATIPSNHNYDHVFLDTNPSFSIYTQLGLATADRLVLPVMADDSSRRALLNAFSLVHGINLPSAMYTQYAFSSRLANAGFSLPQAHLIVKNRLTQYMGPASAYGAVLTSIDNHIASLLASNPSAFTFTTVQDGVAEVRDFQTTGVVAFAEGTYFSRLNSGNHNVQGGTVQVNAPYIQHCREAIESVVDAL
jgi:cellulose biosynthesis protein BcsQ